ncbi:ribonuclease H-like domain-containing protein [Tanacetum coccineum]
MFTSTLAQYVAHKTNVAQQFTPQIHYSLPHPGQGIPGLALAIYASQATTLPSAFSAMPLQDPTWHMDISASSHLNFNASNLSIIFYKRLFPSVHVGDGKSIPVTNTGHSIIPSHHRPLHLHNVLVTNPSTSPTAFLSTSASTWHQRLKHPKDSLKSLYPRVYASESCKNISVASKMAHANMGFSLRRTPRGGVELDQFSAMWSIVEGINLPIMQDRWIWSLTGSGEFSVASVRSLIDDHKLFRVKLDSLPTRLNLSRRGMELDSILCPNCEKAVESSCHIFFACSMVRDLLIKQKLVAKVPPKVFHFGLVFVVKPKTSHREELKERSTHPQNDEDAKRNKPWRTGHEMTEYPIPARGDSIYCGVHGPGKPHIYSLTLRGTLELM